MTYPDDDIPGAASAPPAGKDSKLDALADVIAAYPVGTLVASAAVGAGLMALLSAVSHRAPPPLPPPPRRPIDRVADAAAHSYADLQVQLTQLIRNMSALLPSKAETRQAAENAQAGARTSTEEAGDKATQTWGRLADEAQQVFRDAAPSVQRAGQAVREHPVLASVAVGALGALAAALAMNREVDAPAPAPSEPETPPPM
jgi:ElaB/YqjD/DUF883 family membrane-anchored ribosome-binding protein